MERNGYEHCTKHNTNNHTNYANTDSDTLPNAKTNRSSWQRLGRRSWWLRLLHHANTDSDANASHYASTKCGSME